MFYNNLDIIFFLSSLKFLNVKELFLAQGHYVTQCCFVSATQHPVINKLNMLLYFYYNFTCQLIFSEFFLSVLYVSHYIITYLNIKFLIHDILYHLCISIFINLENVFQLILLSLNLFNYTIS